MIELGEKLANQPLHSSDIAQFPSTLEGALQAIAYFSLSFVCQFQLFALEKELYRPTKFRLYVIIVSSSLIAYVLYNIIAIGSYLQVRAVNNGLQW